MALSDNLIAYYSLGEASGNALDSKGSNNLTDNASVGSATGVVGNCRQFTRASSQFFNIADNTDMSTGDIDFTIALWLQATSPTGFMFAGSKGVGGTREWDLYWNASEGKLHFEAFSASDSHEVASAALSASTWYFVVCWHDSVANQIGIAINAGTATTTAHSTGCRDSTGDFTIGGQGGTNFLNGLVDEFGFWKRVLSSAERTELYNSGAGRTYSYITGVSFDPSTLIQPLPPQMVRRRVKVVSY